MTIVSNSDIETYQKCERMFMYARLMNLRPRELPVFLKRGSFGHKLIEEGFKVLIAGGDIEEISQATGKVLEELLNSGDKDTPEMMKVYRHVMTFINWVMSDSCIWRPVALEDSSLWELAPDLEFNEHTFGFTPDVVVEFTKGLYKGQHAVLDYKFLGQYMRENAIKMSQQILKYIVYRNKMHTDFVIRRGAFVQFNTSADVHATGHKLFLIKWLEPTKTRLERVEYENDIWVRRVAQQYREWENGNKTEKDFLRTVNKDVCNWCFFVELCDKQFDGKKIDHDIKRDFVDNDYGYTNR